jgi:serine/threonine protein kinase
MWYKSKLLSFIILTIFFSNILMPPYIYPENSYNVSSKLQTSPVIFIPSNLGKITNSYIGTQDKTIICIQDLHCNPDAQRKIAGIIDILKQTYKNQVMTIGLEGTPDVEINTNLLGVIPDTKIKDKVINYFLNLGDISGAELYMIKNTKPQMSLYGVENENIYNYGFEALCRSITYRAELENSVEKIGSSLNYIKQVLYTPQMNQLEEMKTKLNKGSIDFNDYALYLLDLAEKYNIPYTKDYPNLNILIKINIQNKNINQSELAVEIDSLTPQIYPLLNDDEKTLLKQLISKKDTTNWYKYISMLINKKNIRIGKSYIELIKYLAISRYEINLNYIQALEEIDDLEFQLKQKMADTGNDLLTLVKCEYYFKTMKDYLWNQISHTKTERWFAYRDNFFENMSKFSEKILPYNYFKEYIDLFKTAEKNMNEFYINAEKRNESIINNILNQDVGRVKILVVGGYHSEGIENILRNMGISYYTITPHIEDTNITNDRYLYRVANQLQWFQKQYPNISIFSKEYYEKQSAMMVISEFYKNTATFNDQVFQEIINATEGNLSLSKSILQEIQRYFPNKITSIKIVDGSIEINGKIYNYTPPAMESNEPNEEGSFVIKENILTPITPDTQPAGSIVVNNVTPQHKTTKTQDTTETKDTKKQEENISNQINSIDFLIGQIQPSLTIPELLNNYLRIKAILDDVYTDSSDRISFLSNYALSFYDKLGNNHDFIKIIERDLNQTNTIGDLPSNIDSITQTNNLTLVFNPTLSINLSKEHSIDKEEKINGTDKEGNKYTVACIPIKTKDDITKYSNWINVLTNFNKDNSFCGYVVNDIDKTQEPLITIYIAEKNLKDYSPLNKLSDTLSMDQIKTIFFNCANELKKMTDAGYILGNVNPENILVDPNNLNVKFADYSNSTPIKNIPSPHLDLGKSIGDNYEYRAPEITSSPQDYPRNSKIDVYSLGVTFGKIIRNNIKPQYKKSKQYHRILEHISKTDPSYPLLEQMLKSNQADRININSVLSNKYFSDLQSKITTRTLSIFQKGLRDRAEKSLSKYSWLSNTELNALINITDESFPEVLEILNNHSNDLDNLSASDLNNFFTQITMLVKNKPEIINILGILQAQKETLKTIEANKLGFQPISSFTNNKLTLNDNTEIAISKKIGEGSFGKVYQGILNQQKVAVKEITINSKDALTDIMNELTAMNEMKDYPNIAKTLKIGYEMQNIIDIYNAKDPTPALKLYIVMPFYEGGDLQTKIKNMENENDPIKKDSLKQALMKNIYETLLALNYMHKKEWNHNDIKPPNIMLNNKGEAVLIDLGLSAKFTDSSSEYKGTSHYISPEIKDGIKKIASERKGKMDIWAIGIMILTIQGLIPLNNSAQVNSSEIYRAISKVQDPNLKYLLRNLLQTDPNKRYSAEQAIDHKYFAQFKSITQTIPTVTALERSKRMLVNLLRETSKITNRAIEIFLRSNEEFLKFLTTNANNLKQKYPNLNKVIDDVIKGTTTTADFIKNLAIKTYDTVSGKYNVLKILKDIASKDTDIKAESNGLEIVIQPRDFRERIDVNTYKDESMEGGIKKTTIVINPLSGLINALKKLEDFHRTLLGNSAEKTFYQDAKSILLHELKEINGESHDNVVKDLNQLDLLNMLENIEWLQNITEINDQNADQVFEKIKSLQDIYKNIYGKELTLNTVVNKFSNVQKEFLKMSGIKINENKAYTEIVLPVDKIRPDLIKNLLASANVLDDNGNIKPRIRIVCVKDMANYNNADQVKKLREELVNLCKTTQEGNFVWVMGNTALGLLNENTPQAKELRTLVSEGIARVGTILSNGTLLLASGYPTEKVINEIIKMRGKIDKQILLQVLDNILTFRTNLISKLGYESIKEFFEPLKSGETWETRIAKLNTIEKFKEIKLDASVTVKLLSLGWMIYGTEGMTKTTNLDEYKKIRDIYPQLKLTALGVNNDIDLEKLQLTFSETNTKDEVIIKTIKLSQILPDTGLILNLIEESNSKPVIEIAKKPDIEIIQFDKPTELTSVVPNIISIISNTISNITGTKTLDIKSLIENLFSKRDLNKKQMETIQKIADSA